MRRFGNQFYSLHDQYLSKREARSVARRLRKQGKLARVVKASGWYFTGDYDVYEASKGV